VLAEQFLFQGGAGGLVDAPGKAQVWAACSSGEWVRMARRPVP
jgi:hypothetical protein